MRMKLPGHVSAVSVEGLQFAADENGFIDVPADATQEMIDTLKNAHGAVPFAQEHADQMRADDVEREALYAHLNELGVPVDRRRRYSLEVLRDLRDDALAARDASPPPAAPSEGSGGQAPGSGEGAGATPARATPARAKPAGAKPAST